MTKQKVAYLLFGLVTVFGFLLESCKKHDVKQNQNFLTLPVPAGWPQPLKNIFEDNQPTEEGFQLGKKLFYDGKLSINGNFPCSSCHIKEAGFGTYDHDLAHGYNGSHTLRNAPALFNLAWMKEFDWDGAYQTIPARIEAHITNAGEMASSMPDVINKLLQEPAYVQLFGQAFGTSSNSSQLITAERITKALTQFLGMMLSANSKYDLVKKGEATFSSFEETGYQIYKSRCAGCHKEPLFTDYTYRSTGLALDPHLNDKGRMRQTNQSADSLKFRVPSLRNLSFTAPYMHDGRIVFIEKVVDHYSTQVINGPTTDTSLLNKPAITTLEKVRLIQFLQTLNDSSFLNNSRY